MSTESQSNETVTTSSNPARPGEPLITEVSGQGTPQWSRRRAMLTAAVVGVFFGAIFFGAYAATSAWICSAQLGCGHWAPITIVAVSGTVASAFVGAAVGYVLHRTYSLFKVT